MMNIFPDEHAFTQQVQQAASKKGLMVFEHGGSYYVLDEATGYVTDSYTLAGAASFVNRFIGEKLRAGL